MATVKQKKMEPMPTKRDFYHLIVNGERVESASGETFVVTNPATGEPVARVAKGTREDAERAVQAARQAFDRGKWRHFPVQKRARILYQIAAIMRERFNELVELEILNTGKALSAAQGQVMQAIEDFEFFAGAIIGHRGAVNPMPGAFHNYTEKEPVGVCAQIIPWNYPLMMAAWKIAPAIAAGCSVVVKPAPETPLTALKLAEICHEAGVPEGVINVLPGLDEAGKALVRHPRVPKIAFTGETETGRHILQAAAPHIKRVTLELGGKSPNIIFADADLEQAAKSALFGVFYNSGQVCQAGSRILVERTVYEPFVERLAERAKKLKVGPGTNPRSDLGPVISREQYEKVLRYIEIGKQEGARLAAGGRALDGGGGGYFIEPTVFADVSPSMRIACEEIFGPVAAVIPFADEEEAVRIANGTMYGLAAAVWTNDIKRALRLARRVKSGTVWLNTYQVLSPTAPFGGYKQSGLGRELGMQALDAYLETKTVICDLNDRPMTLF
ncbi:aldehyde dehydrogenase family protein [Geobacillus thermoleovorans]|uniref:aldehyde dehydrogenase family protein n=1 Tax=Geobacillus thermoleovorans TaxID=33941 RepID=UPI002EA25101|nr:aldehyde dehydrogenase family protein [Geobacillus thermoleovorans]